MLHFSLPNTIQYNRAELKIKAEAEARKTYVFKKPSGSRSIHVQQENGPKPKRSKTSSNEQKEQVSSVSIQLELIKNQISSKQQLSSKASTVKDFPLCSKVQGEMRKLFQEKANHEKMLKMLQTKERNSNSLPPTESSSSLTVDIRSLFTRQQASNTSTCSTLVEKLIYDDKEAHLYTDIYMAETEKVEEDVSTYNNSDEDVVMIPKPADTSDNRPSGDEVLSPGLTNTHDLMTAPVLSTEQSRSTSTGMEEAVLSISPSTAEVIISPPADTSDNHPSIIVQLNDKSGDKVSFPMVTDTHDRNAVPVLSTEQSISTSLPLCNSTGMEEAVLPISPSPAEDEVMISPPADTSNKYPSIIVQLNDKSGNKVLSPIVTDTHNQVAVSVLSTEQSVSNNTSSRNDGSNNFL
jgi:hypothetical protein